jgi:2-ketocyclohexanecarboxyl-CoA hydrolase
MTMMNYTDILYTKADGIATITINRPKQFNAFTANTCEELIHALKNADFDKTIGVIVLTGAGEKAFCTGGDQGTQDGGYGGCGVIGLPIEEVQSAIRDCSKPVIARVNGYAIGGGNVLVTICDLAIASENAQLGQVGPRVGSVDPGFGTALLARVVGEKKAREKKPVKFGTYAVATPHSRRWTWAWSTPSCPKTNWMPKSVNGAMRFWRKVLRRLPWRKSRSTSIPK